MVIPEIELNVFFTTLGIKNKDKIIAINLNYNPIVHYHFIIEK